jgi:large subunit ribosomal protein L4
VDPRPHLVHEAVRAELAAARAGTRGAKSRGLVAGGRAKPWRQKGTGRSRQGTTRAPQWVGGGRAFPPVMRDFSFKVNRKERRAAYRMALSAHAREGTLALFDASAFEEPSTKAAAAFVDTVAKELPLVVVATDEEVGAIKSFRNLPRVAVTLPEDLEVAGIVWARTLLVSEKALPLVEARAGNGKRVEES